MACEGGWTRHSLQVWAGNASAPCTGRVCPLSLLCCRTQGCGLWLSCSLPFRTGHGTLVTEVTDCQGDREIPSWMLNWVRFGGVRSGNGEGGVLYGRAGTVL